VLTTTSVDFFRIDELLSDKQRGLRDELRAYCEETIWPQINPFWERAEFPQALVMGLRDFPIWGGMLHGYGCAGLDATEFGLAVHELARGDGSIGTFYGVQSGLAMGSIGLLGSEEQKQRWLPGMARLELLGAFGLTEPERGSDASHMLTSARREGASYVLDGAKRWIGCASIADLLIIWARDDEGGIGAFVIEQPNATEGVTIVDIEGKLAKRAIPNAAITLRGVRVPAENRLAQSRSFRDTTRVLAFTRYGVAWEAVGAATACFEFALKYAKEREQFGRPIAKSQLIQQKLVEMAADLTQMQLLSLQMARLMDAGQLTEGQAALAKYNNARRARAIAQLARETLGGNGVLLDHHVARHFADLEAVYTYEGTNEINMLVAGRELTGLNAIV
jgi:glutaryl-CoA dehydrogenase